MTQKRTLCHCEERTWFSGGMQKKNARDVIAKEPKATAAISTLAPYRPSIFLGVPTRFAAYVRKEQMPVFRQRSSPCPFVIPTGAQRSGGIWLAIGLILPFETRFLRYVMLRLTPVGMTKGACAFSG